MGLAQLVGFTHLFWQARVSQTGAQFGLGATQVVWHRAGLQTDSHWGQLESSQASLGQRMVQVGFWQWMVHLAQVT